MQNYFIFLCFFDKKYTNQHCAMHPWPMNVARIRVADPDTNWIRIRIQEGKNDP
jgi:hypothetical protein